MHARVPFPAPLGLALAAAAAIGLAAPSTSLAGDGSHHDLDAARASLLAADASLSAASAELGPVDGFATGVAADVLFLPPRGAVVEGRDAARTWLAQNLTPGTAVSWFPLHGDVSGDASRGYTFGWRTVATPRPDGTQRVGNGMYASFWRRQGDRWVVIAHAYTSAYAIPSLPVPELWAFEPNDGALASEGEIDEAEGLAEVMAADRAFSALSVAEGTGVAFGTYAAEEAVLLPGAPDLVYGRAAIEDAYTPRPGDPVFTMKWGPEYAGIAQSGDLGFTVGYAVVTVPDPAAPPRHSKYLSIWKLQPDGTWRFVADIGSGSTPRPAP
ncbi:MAG TPA: DUF4440 domain-containing protein [Anaeromyxobacteraceae bacterium]|nr:DUF4440 domain-containing protein [Anaeromyxobacteraceae bacterium]